MTAPRTPQDRLPKRAAAKKKWTTVDDDGRETLTDFVYNATDGSEIRLGVDELGEVLNPGFVRRNRQLGQEEISFLLLEELDRDDILDLIDYSWADYKQFASAFSEYVSEFMGLSMGESSAS